MLVCCFMLYHLKIIFDWDINLKMIQQKNQNVKHWHIVCVSVPNNLNIFFPILYLHTIRFISIFLKYLKIKCVCVYWKR